MQPSQETSDLQWNISLQDRMFIEKLRDIKAAIEKGKPLPLNFLTPFGVVLYGDIPMLKTLLEQLKTMGIYLQTAAFQKGKHQIELPPGILAAVLNKPESLAYIAHYHGEDVFCGRIASRHDQEPITVNGAYAITAACNHNKSKYPHDVITQAGLYAIEHNLLGALSATLPVTIGDPHCGPDVTAFIPHYPTIRDSLADYHSDPLVEKWLTQCAKGYLQQKAHEKTKGLEAANTKMR